MPKRIQWLEEDSDLPALRTKVETLKTFTDALADGVIDKDELEKQRKNLAAAMKAVEGDLNDEQHDKVTKLLVELTAYTVMEVLHDMVRERVRQVFSK